LADGSTHAQMLSEYPQLKQADITACLQHARELLRAEKVYPSAA
jgi:uncharacterized protein (DUF433 family)